MKRVLFLLLSVALALAITACSHPDQPAGDASVTSSQGGASAAASSAVSSSSESSSASRLESAVSSQLEEEASSNRETSAAAPAQEAVQDAQQESPAPEPSSPSRVEKDPQPEAVPSSSSQADVSVKPQPPVSEPPAPPPPVVVPPVSSAPSKPELPSQPEQSIPTPGTKVEQVAALVNQERAKVGLSPLTLDAELSANAMVRAQEIVTKFDHTRPDGSKFYSAITIPWKTVGENIAWGQKTPEAVMNSWMNSDGHRANILKSAYQKIGVGVYETNGRLYWVQLFTG